MSGNFKNLINTDKQNQDNKSINRRRRVQGAFAGGLVNEVRMNTSADLMTQSHKKKHLQTALHKFTVLPMKKSSFLLLNLKMTANPAGTCTSPNEYWKEVPSKRTQDLQAPLAGPRNVRRWCWQPVTSVTCPGDFRDMS